MVMFASILERRISFRKNVKILIPIESTRMIFLDLSELSESVIFFGMKVLCFSKHAVNFSMQPIRFIRSNFPRVIENYDH